MKRKHYKTEQIIMKSKETDVMVRHGKTFHKPLIRDS